MANIDIFLLACVKLGNLKLSQANKILVRVKIIIQSELIIFDVDYVSSLSIPFFF